MARPAVHINVLTTIELFEHAGWSLNFTHEEIVRKALKVAHPDYLTNRLPVPATFVKQLRVIPVELRGSLTCRQLWDFFPEKSYTCIHQWFKYLKSVNAAMAYHYGYDITPTNT